MLKKIFFLVFFCFLSQSAAENLKEEYLIRRCYITALGRIPTIGEIDWYCVYNTDGYNKAIEYILDSPEYKLNLPKEYARVLFYGSGFINAPKFSLTTDQIYHNISYVCGKKDLPITKENMDWILKYFIKIALEYSYNVQDTIDFMASCLMSRVTSVSEINFLTRIYDQNKEDPEKAWLEVLKELLKIEDVKSM